MELEIDCFECLVCGYIYNPEEGDPAGGDPARCDILQPAG